MVDEMMTEFRKIGVGIDGMADLFGMLLLATAGGSMMFFTVAAIFTSFKNRQVPSAFDAIIGTAGAAVGAWMLYLVVASF